jgi:hypothetical protein
MALYKEQSGTATQYTRAHAITINNPYEGTPSINFQEESIITLPDGAVLHNSTWSPYNMGIMYDPAGIIELINPETDAPLGAQVTHQELMVTLYSLYRKLALERDAKIVSDAAALAEAQAAAEAAAAEMQAAAQALAAEQAAQAIAMQASLNNPPAP